MADWTRWTKEEIAFLREKVIDSGMSHAEAAALMNETFGTDVFNAMRIKNRLRTEHAGTGYTNKGKPNTSSTKFKKGCISGAARQNLRAVGTDVMHADGYLWRKVKDGVPFPRSCRPAHKVVWGDAHGPVPKGMCVTFLDGDRTNIGLSNLALVSRAVNARLNQNDLRALDRGITAAAIAAAELMTEIGKIGKTKTNAKRKRGEQNETS
jgi:hypothetical protein